jgi:hypothetical protein
MKLSWVPKNKVDRGFLEHLHLTTFGAELPHDFFRYDALLIAGDDTTMFSYTLVREISSETVELAWGGTSTEHRGFRSLKILSSFCEEVFKEYKYVTIQVHNKNYPMLKLALGNGFTIIGTRATESGDIYVIFNKSREE